MILMALLINFAIYAGMGAGIVFLISMIIRSERKVKEKAYAKLMENEMLTGVITDAAFEQGRSPRPYRYRYAVAYIDRTGMERHAFFGIASEQMLPYTVGSQVRLRRFSQPQISIRDRDRADLMDPTRGANGRLPNWVRFCVFNNTPIDETGTLMLNADYESMMEKMTHTITSWKKYSKVLNIIALILLIITILFGLGVVGMVVYLSQVIESGVESGIL